MTCILAGPHTGSDYLRPILGPLTNMLQTLQECSQLELALRVLVNSYGSCLQHITSNVMDVKLSLQVQYDCHSPGPAVPKPLVFHSSGSCGFRT